MKSAISVQGLGKRYRLAHQATRSYRTLRDDISGWFAGLGKRKPASSAEDFWALDDVSFEVMPGEIVGIIGRNGAGKSTLLKILSRITPPTRGEVIMRGRAGSLLEVGTGFHPELSGRENIFLSGAILGMKGPQVRASFDEIVAFSEVEKFLDTPVKRYSSGMYVRLAFAVAAHLEPDILIVDEVLAVGDSAFQKKCLGKMQSVSEKEGRTVLFVSHNMQAMRQMSQRIIYLQQGRVAFAGEPHAAITAYLEQSSSAAGSLDLTTLARRQAPDGAHLCRLQFLDEAGRPATRVTFPGSLTVEVDVELTKSAAEFDISMAVVHSEGIRVFSEAYSDQFAKPSLGPGKYRFRFEIPLRFLKLESYFLALTLAGGGRLCDHVEGIQMPEIINDNSDQHMETNRWGVARLPVQWQTVQTVT